MKKFITFFLFFGMLIISITKANAQNVVQGASAIDATPLIDTSLQKNNVRVYKNTEPVVYQSRQIPAGYPVFVETGNRAADIESYNLKKNEWIAKHAAEYKAISGQESASPKVQEIPEKKATGKVIPSNK